MQPYRNPTFNNKPKCWVAKRTATQPTQLVFLAPRLVSPSTPDKIRGWLELIADSLDGEMLETDYTNPMFRNIVTDIRRSTLSPEERAEILDEKAWEQAQSQFDSEALTDALAKGLAEGKAEGLAEGLDEGLAEGQIRERTNLVRTMLERGATIELIAQFTGMTEAEIKQVQL